MCDADPPQPTPEEHFSTTYLSLRWSPSMAGCAAITGELPDVMLKQWRAGWTALAGCRWRYPPTSDRAARRPRAPEHVNNTRPPRNCEPPRSPCVGTMPEHQGSPKVSSEELLGAPNFYLCGSRHSHIGPSAPRRLGPSRITVEKSGSDGTRPDRTLTSWGQTKLNTSLYHRNNY